MTAARHELYRQTLDAARAELRAVLNILETARVAPASAEIGLMRACERLVGAAVLIAGALDGRASPGLDYPTAGGWRLIREREPASGLPLRGLSGCASHPPGRDDPHGCQPVGKADAPSRPAPRTES